MPLLVMFSVLTEHGISCVDADIDEDYEEEIMLDIGEVNAASQDSIEVGACYLYIFY